MFSSAAVIAVGTIFCLSSFSFAEKYKSGDIEDVYAATRFLLEFEEKALEYCKKSNIANWAFETDLTQENKEKKLKVSAEVSLFAKEVRKNATQFAWKGFKDHDPKMYRMFKMLAIEGSAALPEEKQNELRNLVADMSNIYSTTKLCGRSLGCENPTLDFESGLKQIMAMSENYDELERIWVEWRDKTGKMMRDSYLRYMDLKNEAARLNGFNDAGELWREAYECDDFQDQMEKLWLDLFPFYTQLHAYVRRKLMEKHPEKIKPDGPIPAHLLGNMWAQSWHALFERMKPYPEETGVDATPMMKAKDMTTHQMFEISEEFFASLGLLKMTPEFWNNSVIEKPEGREMVCHASAWDFCDGKDVRIKMCTKINMENLITIHHEMGHVEYYLQYAKQPYLFRNGANPGFHEAVGDVLALSVSTPKHLKKLGLLEEVKESEEADINYLLNMALDKIAFLPFAYSIDLWRWNVFSGNISREELNAKWWEIRLLHQGICPPVPRTEEDLDPASKYHVIADVPYIRYFVSFVIQFQFHKALCEEAGHTGPLHKCDIYQNKKAGKLLSDVLSLGKSVHWSEAMSIMTRGKTKQMDVSGILEYFDPLIKWLDLQNSDGTVGWKNDDPTRCP